MENETRTISVKRAMTRCKTIDAQLSGIEQKIAKYGAGSSKSRFDIVDTRTSRKKNHEETRKEMSSLFQQFNDLTKEYVKLQVAIRKANLTATVVIKDTVMTLAEALVYQQKIQGHVNSLVNSYNRSVSSAEMKVDRENGNVNLDGLTKEEREEEMSRIVYNVPPELIKEKEEFLQASLEELNGLLDEASISTYIEL